MTIYLEKGKGGLGIKELSIFYELLLCKWSWHFANKRETLWDKVVRGKYGEEQGGWCSEEVRAGSMGWGVESN